VVKRLDLAELGNLGRSVSKIAPTSSALRAAQSGLVGPLGASAALRKFSNSPISRILENQRRFNNLINPAHLNTATALSHLTSEPITPLINYNALKMHEHDPEKFYFDTWKANIPVAAGALTCDLWRHQRGSEAIEFEVVFTKDGDTRGAVLCTVHAENLTKPVYSRIPVSRIIEEFSPIDSANKMVEKL